MTARCGEPILEADHPDLEVDVADLQPTYLAQPRPGLGRECEDRPNYGRPGEGARLEEGMALAIEPMVNAGGADVVALADQWTVVTVDRKISAHFEHTVAIGPNGPEVLSLVEAD